jgi:hypothetical protein
MKKRILFLVLVLSFISCNPVTGNKKLQLEKDKNFPLWLAIGDYHTDQTSGIAYINTDGKGFKNFLLADDTGVIHHLVLSENSIVNIKKVSVSAEVDDYFSVFPKKDFEEIVYDKYSNSVYLSVEGNLPAPKDFTGIFRLNFAGNNIFSDSIVSVTKLDIKPAALFTKYLSANIAYEGVSADENYLYLGLEGFQDGKFFADSTILFIVDKVSLSIVKEINTRSLGIHTICGLYSDKNKSLYGIDRNNKKVFHILFNDSMEIIETDTLPVSTNIPGYDSISYVASLESVTLDDEGNLYVVDDPWKTFFIPPQDVLSRLDDKTAGNFKKYIPVLFKFKQIK